MPLLPVVIPPKIDLWLEGSAVYQIANDARVPGNGSNVDYRDLLGKNPGNVGRLTLFGSLDSDSGWRLVYAPLSVSGSGSFSKPVRFDGAVFAAGTPTNGKYRFDSYRLTYWRRASQSDRTFWRFGYTLKLRDAEVSLSQPGLSRRFKNTGFVPLLHLSGIHRLSERTELLVDFDGLVSLQGSALDLGVYLRQNVSPRVGILAGLRGLFGGVDNDDTYNSAGIGYLSIGVSVRS